MVITNWRQAAPTIVHQYGIDYKLLKGQADFSPDVPNYCMRGHAVCSLCHAPDR